jgi:organic radical activating enzyme
MSLFQMMAVWMRLFFRRTVGLSIDITDQCPHSCPGCYMRWYPKGNDLPLKRWREIIESHPARSRYFCAWTGGEPLLRADDIAELSQLFGWNWIATSGTIPIPDIPRTTVFVSVDGPAEIHNRVRGRWSDVAANVRSDHYVACTVQKKNCSPDVLREHVDFWSTRAAGMVFGFLTPQKGDEGKSLSHEERADVLATVRDLRRRYGRFVIGAAGQLKDCSGTTWHPGCPAEASLVTFDAQGNRKTPCTLGPDVDCGRCGCAVPGFLSRVRWLHPWTLRDVVRLFR